MLSFRGKDEGLHLSGGGMKGYLGFPGMRAQGFGWALITRDSIAPHKGTCRAISQTVLSTYLGNTNPKFSRYRDSTLDCAYIYIAYIFRNL